MLKEGLQSWEISTNLLKINAERPFLTHHFADYNSAELGYDVMKGTKYFVLLYANVVTNEELNVVANIKDLIGATEYLTL